MNEPLKDHRTAVRGRIPLWLLPLAAFIFLAGCGEKAATGPAKRPAVSGVSVAALEPVSVDEITEATGTVIASKVSVVSSRVMGTVTALLVKEGDPVEPGQLLLTIDDRDAAEREAGAEAGLKEAEKALEAAGKNRELAEVTFKRYGKMYEEKAISRQEMDQFETAHRLAGVEVERVQQMVKRAAAGLAEARLFRSFSRVTSPIRGRVTEKRTDPGSMAVPGMPLLTLEGTASYEARIAVDESLARSLRIGMPVRVAIPALNLQTSGKITEILPAVDPGSRSLTAKVALSGPGLRSGLYVKVGIVSGKREVLLAPRPAVVEKGQLTGLYAVDGSGVVSFRLVRTGRESGGRLEILSGVKAGERVIVSGVEKAVDGGLVEKGI
jgi:RND family efflux transporter MFP subunit